MTKGKKCELEYKRKDKCARKVEFKVNSGMKYGVEK